MRSKSFIFFLLLLGSMSFALSSCDKETIVMESEQPTQAELNIQMLESYTNNVELKYYGFVSEALNINGLLTKSYVLEYPFVAIPSLDDVYKFNMNELIAFKMDTSTRILYLYFP